ncbi:YkoF-like protein [Trametes elegans]|nr:YkoF-like protein [Trametes elegans]
MAQPTSSSSDLYAIADFCLIPMGTAEPSVAEYIAECVRVLEKTGLKFKCLRARASVPLPSGYGTNLEGPWSEVMRAIHDCHAAVHAKGAPRVATDIRIGTRVDREIAPGTGNEGKVKRVEEILAKDRH